MILSPAKQVRPVVAERNAPDGGIVLADDAIVVQSDGDIVLVATPERFAPAIAAAIAKGDVALLVKP